MRGISEERLIYWFDLFVSKKRLQELEVVITLIDECQELSPWMPIESAPKDRKILVYIPRTRSIMITIKREGDFDPKYHEPTHWKELPEPPK